MTKNKKLINPCKKLRKIEPTKRHLSLICALLIAALLIVVASLVSSTSLFSAAIVEPALTESQSEALSLKTSLEQSDQLHITEPQFGVNIAYAYVGPRKDHFICQNPLQDKIPVATLNAESLYPVLIYLNITHISNAEVKSCDAKLTVYLVQLSANTGATESYLYVEGTNYDPAFSDLSPLSSHISDFDEAYTSNGLSGGFIFNWTVNTSNLGGRIGSCGSYSSKSSGLGLWSAGEPNTIIVSVHRIGSISADGESVSAAADVDSENLVQVPLERYGDGFIYNTIVSQQKLSQIDVFNPPIPET
jgi:hypothetical protein